MSMLLTGQCVYTNKCVLTTAMVHSASWGELDVSMLLSIVGHCEFVVCD